MQKIRCYLVLAVYLFLSGGIKAQELVSYSVSEGVAHTNILGFFHDPDGYLWIATWDGLSRYDGNTFTTYKNDPNDTTTIGSNLITKITKDSGGRIWVIGGRYLQQYQNTSDNFQRVHLRGENIPTSGISDLCFDKTGQGWLLDDEGLACLNPEQRTVRYINISEFYMKSGKIIPDSAGLWITGWKGLFHFSFHTLEKKTDIKTEDADHAFLIDNKDISTQPGFDMIESKGTFILLNSDDEIFVSDKKTMTLQHIPCPTSANGSRLFQTFKHMYEIEPGKILFSTDYPGIIILNLKDLSFEFTHTVGNIVGNKTNFNLYEDHQKNLWIGGIGGLQKYTQPQLNFKAWLCEPGKPNSLSGRALTALYKDHNNILWVGSRDGGLDKVDLRDNSVVNIKLPAELKKRYADKNVFALTPLNSEELLVNIDSVLLRYNMAHNRFSVFKPVDFHVYKIFKDSNENLWVSERDKISIVNLKRPEYLLKTIDSHDFSSPVNTRDIYEAKNGQIWLANSIGLVKLNVENPKASREFVPPGSETDPEVFYIHETKNGTFWLGTIRNGVFAFDPETEEFTAHYSTNEGLIDNSVNVIFEDKTGKLWMSTWKGISVLNPEDGSIENYSTINGLPFPEFNTNAHFLDDDGTMYFGGEGGVVAFHPDYFVRFNPETPLVINSIAGEQGLMALNYPLKGGESVKIPNTQNIFEISFCALDFRHPEDRIYRYRLHGFQDEWKTAKQGNLTATFAGLSPGLYIFEVQSTYRGWPWNNEETKVFINIEAPPFYRRQVFLLMIAFAFLITLVMVIILRMRNKTIQKEIEITHLEKQANQSTLNFLKSQMNPHFYFNTLNAINSYILLNDVRSANKYLATFAKLMREILENSQKDFVTVAEEKEVLEKYLTLQRLRFPKVFDFRIEADKDVLQKRIPPMLLQPFVENSVEYAFGGMTAMGEIAVRFTMADNQTIATITDNGIGTEKSMKLKTQSNRKSTAIKNIHSRIAVFNKMYSTNIQISILPHKPENIEFPGTIVSLVFPDFINEEVKTEDSKNKPSIS